MVLLKYVIDTGEARVNNHGWSPIPNPVRALLLLFIIIVLKIELYSWEAKSSAKPKLENVVRLFNGRFSVRDLIISLGIMSLQSFDTGFTVAMLEDGLSADVYEGESTLKLRMKEHQSPDITIGFSSAKLEDVLLDFDMRFTEDRYWLQDTEISHASDIVSQVLGDYSRFNTKRSEASRRFIISTLTLYATMEVDGGDNVMVIDEEAKFECTTHSTRNNVHRTVKYNGPYDYSIGHARQLTKILEDASVTIIEAKKWQKFEESIPQVLAQAATSLIIRRNNARGYDKSGGPVFFVLSDGENWMFGKLEAGKGTKITATHSDILRVNINDPIDNLSLDKVYSCLVRVIKAGRDSSPRGSMQNLTEQ